MSELKCTNAHTSRHVLNATERGRRGFTMTELLAVIAILAVMAGIVFVAISQIQKNVQQEELDGTAKELFIVAQNHLSTAESQGMLDRIRKSRSGDRSYVGENAGGSVYYFAMGESYATTALNSSNVTVLNQMLPYGSIDETVRTGGTYVIRYDLEAAKVLDVFYANKSRTSLFGASSDNAEFVNGDYSVLFANGSPYIQDNPTGKDARQKYVFANGGSTECIIGWYGGEAARNLASTNLDRPMLKVENAERLVATVTLPRTNNFLSLKLIIKGDTSGVSRTVILKSDQAGVVPSGNVTVVSSTEYSIVLDDITYQGEHFAKLYGGPEHGFTTPDGKGLIPGENISIQAVASSSTALATVKKSAMVHRNSLFSSVDTDGKVHVSNIRHLENLSYDVSGFDPTLVLQDTDANQRWHNFISKSAMQESDLSWTTFVGKIKTTGRAPSTVEVSSFVPSASLGIQGDSFAPIFPGTRASSYDLQYDGQSHEISDVTIARSTSSTTSNDAGLFDALTGGSISNVTLVNFSVTAVANGANAGALAGSTTGTSISGVLAYNKAGSSSSLEVRSSGNAGGLVGSMSGGKLEKSAAALYVRSTGGAAGGLVGSASGTAAIEQSYAGGHTIDGAFSDSRTDGAAGRVNVIAASDAGGLVGDASAATSLGIRQSYSTASVYGGTNAGGLVGAMGGGSIEDSYMANTVATAEQGSKGVFAGTASSAATFTGNTYIEMLNDPESMNTVGMAAGQASAADANTASYQGFANGVAAAVPYDQTLVTRYHGTYPFKTIAALAGGGSGNLNMHYGDWPSLETFIVN